MRRRDFLALSAGVVAISSVRARAQHATAISRVGVLWHAANAEEEALAIAVALRAAREYAREITAVVTVAENGGFVVSAAIDHYVYVTANRRFYDSIRPLTAAEQRVVERLPAE